MKLAGVTIPAFAWVIGGWLAGLGTIGAAGLAVVAFGLFDVRASTPHGPLMAWATHTTFIHATQRRAASAPAPPSFTPADVQAGFRDYDSLCVACHGGPGISRQEWASGLNPPPPYLLDSARTWTPAQLKIVIGDGAKMTAMPAWKTTLSDRRQWNLVAFLEALPYLSNSDYVKMRAAKRPPAGVAD
jgi:mono/diheme cytochrome c family protein